MEPARVGEVVQRLKIVLKADVQGSAEALRAALVKLCQAEGQVSVIAAAVGGIRRSAASEGGLEYRGFHDCPASKNSPSRETSRDQFAHLPATSDPQRSTVVAMAGLLSALQYGAEVNVDKLQVRETCSIPKIGTGRGCMVTDSKINHKAHLRIVRDAVPAVYEGKIGSPHRLRRRRQRGPSTEFRVRRDGRRLERDQDR